MIASTSTSMIRRSFGKQVYRFETVPQSRVGENFGVYVNVPLCKSKCAFCPFYKEQLTVENKTRYLGAIIDEIERSPVTGETNWVYFGGGTPNTLSISELATITNSLKSKINSTSWGIELLPELVDDAYLYHLWEAGFTKISIGVESFDRNVIKDAGRKSSTPRHIANIIARSESLGLWSNADIMVGLPGQSPRSFINDIKSLAVMSPSQITIYPYMVIRGVEQHSPLSNQRQFELIETAGELLEEMGYGRKGVWVFARGDDVYDSSRDELVTDYVGFGPGAFSTYGGWKIVNPELEAYCKSLSENARKAFVAPKTEATDQWRLFARVLYDLRSPDGQKYPSYISSYISLLKLAGYIKNGKLTEKGIYLSHHITKTVVESLPFPVQNPDAVENYGEYLAYIGELATVS